jgi:hypothetical protein
VLDTFDPLPKTKFGNKYVLMAIDHYSKWCHTKPMKKHIAIVVAKFLEEEIICRFGVSKYFLLTTVVNGWLSLICFAKTMGSFTSSLPPNGHNVMEWQRGW